MAGYKTWTDPEILYSADINSYLMSQAVPRFATTTARDTAIPSPAEGQLSYITGTGLCMYTGSTWTYLPRGCPVTPTTASTNGTTAVGATETRDAVLGNYVFTAYANRRYKICYNGAATMDTANSTYEVRIRDGGASTPTTSSTIVATTNISAGFVNAYVPAGVTNTVMFSAGVHTLSVFHVRSFATGANLIPVGSPRQLWVEDIGAV